MSTEDRYICFREFCVIEPNKKCYWGLGEPIGIKYFKVKYVETLTIYNKTYYTNIDSKQRVCAEYIKYGIDPYNEHGHNIDVTYYVELHLNDGEKIVCVTPHKPVCVTLEDMLC